MKMVRDRLYTLRDGADAANLKLDTLKQWIKRGKIVFTHDEMKRATKGGEPHLITYQTVMRIAIMWWLVRCGCSPDRALLAALTFTMSSIDVLRKGAKRRSPGELYSTGETYLIVPADEEQPPQPFNLQPAQSPALLFNKAIAGNFLHLNPLIQGLDERLAAVPEREVPDKDAA
jgi:hypothetical protein